MIRLSAFLICMMISAYVTAQESVEAFDQAVKEEITCIPAAKVEQSSESESGPSQEGRSELPICEEEIEDSEGLSDSAEALDPKEENPPEDENIEPEPEFEPEEEISEDFPVPLPSDI